MARETKATREARADAIARLIESYRVEPGATVYTISRHTARSGVQRSISLLVPSRSESVPSVIDYLATDILGHRVDQKNGGLIVGGCGMDMGFALVYALGHALYPEGFGIAAYGDVHGDNKGDDGVHRFERGAAPRPATKAEAERMNACGYLFRGRNGDTSGWDNDGGYALRHVWL